MRPLRGYRMRVQFKVSLFFEKINGLNDARLSDEGDFK